MLTDLGANESRQITCALNFELIEKVNLRTDGD